MEVRLLDIEGRPVQDTAIEGLREVLKEALGKAETSIAQLNKERRLTWKDLNTPIGPPDMNVITQRKANQREIVRREAQNIWKVVLPREKPELRLDPDSLCADLEYRTGWNVRMRTSGRVYQGEDIGALLDYIWDIEFGSQFDPPPFGT